MGMDTVLWKETRGIGYAVLFLALGLMFYAFAIWTNVFQVANSRTVWKRQPAVVGQTFAQHNPTRALFTCAVAGPLIVVILTCGGLFNATVTRVTRSEVVSATLLGTWPAGLAWRFPIKHIVQASVVESCDIAAKLKREGPGVLIVSGANEPLRVYRMYNDAHGILLVLKDGRMVFLGLRHPEGALAAIQEAKKLNV